MSSPPLVITCVECGGRAHLISFLPEDEPIDAGYPLAYRCAECVERFDIIWEDPAD